MAIGDKKPVVMETDRAIPGGVATLDAEGILEQAQRPTLEMLGAALAGYGYGDTLEAVMFDSADETYESFCAKVDAVLDKMPIMTAKQIVANPPELFGQGASLCALYKSSSDDYASLRTISHYSLRTMGFSMVKDGGVWQPLEWINPPMKVGVEYRTTERYNGKVVYKKTDSSGIVYWRTEEETEWHTYSEIVGSTKIATGSYTGDGSTSKAFSFGFTAQILFLFAKTDFILSNYYVRSAAVFFNGSGTGIIGTTFTNANSMDLLTGHTFDGSTVSNNSSSPVWNMSGATYGYIAIG